MLDFGLVREALQERGLLLTRLAPHLVRPVPFLYPLSHRGWERPYVGAGLALYDAMAMAGKHDMGVPRHRHLLRRRVARIAPDLRTDALTGAIRYHDAQVDDARLVTTLARTAAAHGAHCASGSRWSASCARGSGSPVRAPGPGRRVVRSTCGPGSSSTPPGCGPTRSRSLVGGRGALHVQASKGIHLVVPRDRIRSAAGLIMRTEKSVLFVIPWGRHWIIGTTDTKWDLDKAHPAASRADIDYLLERVNTVLKEPLDHDDVEGVYAGLRPLLTGVGADQPDLARAHRGHAGPGPGDHRRRQADDVPGDGQGRRRRGPALPGRSRDPRLDHRPGSPGRCRGLRDPGEPAGGAGASRPAAPARIDHLLGRYGDLVDEVLALVADEPDLAEPLEGAEDYLRAEVVYAVTHEERGTSTTCSPGAPGSPSRPSTGACTQRVPPQS